MAALWVPKGTEERLVAASLLLLCLGGPFLPLVGATGQAEGGSDPPAAPHRRFEYKYSFKGPHLVQGDGSVPFWVHTGMWTKSKSIFEYWEIEVTFRVTGRGRVGADGLKNNPAVIIVGNNGKLHYDHQNDGSTQALASCQRDFRNKPYPVRAKITYYQKTLTASSQYTFEEGVKFEPNTVFINNGFTPDKEDYEYCAKVENMVLPSQGYFGISAATGGLADDHDVLSFLTFQLMEPGKEAPPPDTEIPEKDKEKYQEQFEHFQQELDKKKEEFQKEHPDVQGQPTEDLFETVGDRELRQIFEGQNRIHLEIKQLNRQLDMILDEQRRYVSSLTDEISRRASGVPGQVSQQGLETFAKTQEEVLRQVGEMKNSMGEALRLVSGIQHVGSAGGVYETTQHFNDIKEHLHVVKRDIEHLVQRNLVSARSSSQEVLLMTSLHSVDICRASHEL
ncbi:hypothetical protein JD844_008375 [Phrynosoma platyrhinos]|uniref:L-type lectin-like domain-containing protein n=1 Tax=Phrynosoma platyrhinos TaxID=52577 RepID=A0ABQ7TDN8_PHRPL|nr:hypothetical protein JD844_008375 [Phrynosoma platyrhinos]